MKIYIEFEPRDLWIGLFINSAKTSCGNWVNKFYLCLIPMFPITFETKAWREWHEAIRGGR